METPLTSLLLKQRLNNAERFGVTYPSMVPDATWVRQESHEIESTAAG